MQVYPRVGGGNGRHVVNYVTKYGLSPRGRGKRIQEGSIEAIPRSIPAWAGETARYEAGQAHPAVYPRVGGGNGFTPRLFTAHSGLSPRGRGKRAYRCADPAARRSIPAWAGETVGYAPEDSADPVYPRVGGGNVLSRLPEKAIKGLSPRGRGKREAFEREQGVDRSIPAWAGETITASAIACASAVYPRVGGGNAVWRQPWRQAWGLSPRGRGKLL